MSTTPSQWPIRVRRTLEPNGAISASRSVLCRALGHSLDLYQCERCPHSAGLTTDGEGHPTQVRCARAHTPEDPTPVQLRDPPQTTAGATPLSSVMTSKVWCLAPGLATGEARRFLSEHNLGGAPVVDHEGFPIGVLTRTDLVGRTTPATVGETMSPVAFTLDERSSLAHAAALMAVEGVHHLPVVAEDGRVVGIVSALDVTAWVARQEGYAV